MTYTKKMHDAIKRDIKDGKNTITTDLLKEIERLQKENDKLKKQIEELKQEGKDEVDCLRNMQNEEHW